MDDQILDLLCKASGSGFAEYDEMREFCKNRDSREWGIPAIICLDDLTDPDRPAYEMSEVDEKLHERMAVEAMLFNYVQAHPFLKEAGYRYLMSNLKLEKLI